MNTNRLFFGDIYICLYSGYIGHHFGPIETKQLVKKNALLIKCSDKGYIDIDSFDTTMQYMKLKRNKCFLSTTPFHKGELYVDKNSLKEADLFNMDGNVKVKEIKLAYKNEFRK